MQNQTINILAVNWQLFPVRGISGVGGIFCLEWGAYFWGGLKFPDKMRKMGRKSVRDLLPKKPVHIISQVVFRARVHHHFECVFKYEIRDWKKECSRALSKYFFCVGEDVAIVHPTPGILTFKITFTLTFFLA